nr:hypothetical protein [Verrucomicrobiota bacterium]
VLSAGQGFQLNDDLRLSIFAEMDSEVWRTYVGLTNTRPGLSTNLRYRFGLGKDAPWIRLESKLDYVDFNEARRSGWDVRPGLRGGVSLTERVRLEAAYEYEHFDARDVVFQHDGHTVAFHGKIDLTASTRLVIGYTYRHGDVTSAATPPRLRRVPTSSKSQQISMSRFALSASLTLRTGSKLRPTLVQSRSIRR